MKIKDITTELEKIAPISTAMDFDNVGLLVGSDDVECTGVLLTVDVTKKALAEAEKNGCNLIIAHHPIIFNPMKNFLSDNYQAALIAEAYTKNVAIYAAHTNVDCMADNMAARLLKKLGAYDVKSLIDNGLGAIGDIKPLSLAELEINVFEALSDNHTFTVGCKNGTVKRVASVNGAGADEETLQAAINQGADVFISADLKHHIMLFAKETGLKLISVGHYASEKSFNDIVYDSVMCHFDTIKTIKYYEGNPYD